MVLRKHRVFISAAIHEAQKSTMRCKHGSVITCDGIIVSRGYNYRVFTGSSFSVHAEEVAISRLPCHLRRNCDDDSKLCLYVIRLGQNGEVTNSKPCRKCTARIKSMFNIYKIFFSCDNIRD